VNAPRAGDDHTAPITPLPAEIIAAVRAGTPIILFGGTFDPPHLGHVQVPLAARNAALPSALVLYIPAARNPQKPATGASDADRLAMLRLALASTPRTAIWTDELDRAAYARHQSRASAASYTIDTLTRFMTASLAQGAHALPKQPTLRLLIGADQAARFNTWREWRDVINLAPPIVMLRAPLDTAETLNRELDRQHWPTADRAPFLDHVVRAPTHPASATHIRAGDYTHLDPRVAEYIRTRDLYKT
jgi:nicotinate-nucleotide adenylyltransferase